MAASYNTFQRLKDKGVAAYKRGDYTAARPYLLQAAECGVQLAEEARSEDLRRQYEDLSEELIDLARSCSRRPGRFDALIYVPLPDAPARYRLLEIYLGHRPLADDVDFGVLCDRLAGYSGADIKNVAERAATVPFMESVTGKEPRPICMADLAAVIDETAPSVRPSDLKRYADYANSGA